MSGQISDTEPAPDARPDDTDDADDDHLIGAQALAELDAVIERAFATGDHEHLQVLGYGEVSSVIAWPGERGQVACKRLPVFSDRARFEAYEACLARYLAALATAGVKVVDTRLYGLDSADGRVVGYCVQPVLARDSLGPNVFAHSEARALMLWQRILERISSCVSPSLGLDSQLSNWALVSDKRAGQAGEAGAGEDTAGEAGEALVYLDVSTPMMRDADGREALDTDLFLSSLPWALRPMVKRFMLRGILATYYDQRRVMVDFLANLHKERLAHLLPALIEHGNRELERPITQDEVARYYRDDARTWALLQRLRRMDRSWQYRVRRRPYPFLLPGPIER